MEENEKKEEEPQSRREFLKKALGSAFALSAGLFFGSKETIANVIGIGSGACSTYYSCSGGSGNCSSYYS